MKKSVLSCLLLLSWFAGPACAADGAGASRLSLLCTGWLPAYTNWETPQAAGAARDAQLQVEIDRASGTLSTALAATGPLTAPLEISDRFYAGTSALGRVLYNRGLDAVEISINRLTGEARLTYMVGETSYPAFSGNCARRG